MKSGLAQNAHSIRNGWLGSITSSLFRFKPVNYHHTSREKSPFLHLRKKERLQPARFWTQVFHSVSLLHYTIIAIVCLLVAIFAFVSISSLVNWGKRTEQAAEIQLNLLSQIVVQQLQKNPSLEMALSSPTLGELYLNNAYPAVPSIPGQVVYLLDKDKKIIATHPNQDKHKGLLLGQLTDDSFSFFGTQKNPQVNRVNIDGTTPSLAIYRPLETRANRIIGGVLLVHSQQSAFADWRFEVMKSINLFLVVSSTLVILLLVYLSQVAQARATNQLYLETNARFDTALARGRCGLWDWDLARGRIVWSSSMYKILGMNPSDGILSYGEINELVHPQDLDLMELANHSFQQPNGNVDHKFRMMHKSGTWVWMRIRAELVRHKNTSPHLIGIAVDISEQEAIKQQSHNADMRLRDAIETISEAFVLWDSRKRMVMCNSKYQQLYQLPASAVVSGAHYKDVMSKSRKPRARKQVSTDSKNENGAKTFQAQIEGDRWLQISERRTLDGGFVSVGTDITEIKRNQKELERSEWLHMETIADLRKSQLELEKQAQKLVEFADNLNEEKKRADAGNKAKSEFLANISHELRTPLNAIIGFSDIMCSQMFGALGSEKYDEYANDIHQSGNFLLGVINDILDMSKIEAGRFLINPETVHLSVVLEETIRVIQIQADEANITVTRKIPESLELEADRRAIKQILLNLLSNAVKFTKEGGQIDVTVKRRKNSIKIAIKDNGIGIAKEALGRLTQPFEQVQDQFTKDHKGSGLGLAIARSLATLHGGTLKIFSTLGEGTKVVVHLPLQCDIENNKNKVKREETSA